MRITESQLRRIIKESIRLTEAYEQFGREIQFHPFNVDQSISLYEDKENGVYTIIPKGIVRDDLHDNSHYDIESKEEAMAIFEDAVEYLEPLYADHDLYREKRGSIPRHAYGSRSALARPRY